MPLSKKVKHGSIGFAQGVMIGMAIIMALVPRLERSDPDSQCATEKNALVEHYNKERDKLPFAMGATFFVLCAFVLAILLSPTEKKKRQCSTCEDKITTGASGRPAGAWREACGSRHRQANSNDAKAAY